MDAELTALVSQGVTADGLGFAVAGVCRRASGLTAAGLAAVFEALTIRLPVDAFDLDLRLAQYARHQCPPTVVALGLSVLVPGVPGPCGAIIGDPGVPPGSACERAEAIGHGLSMAARPGGPGIVVLGPPSLAERVLSGVTPTFRTLRGEQSPKRRCDPLCCPLCCQLCEIARRFGAPLALAVTDGTGAPAPGGVAVLADGSIRWATLPGTASKSLPPLTAP